MNFTDRTRAVAQCTTQIRALCPWIEPHVAACLAMQFVHIEEGRA